ncbi:Kelch repeat-containing protein, partial [Pyxidicoccus sp. 3LG]
MKTTPRVLLPLGGVLLLLAGCTDFDRELKDFCTNNPDRCEGRADGGPPGGGDGGPPYFTKTPEASSYVEGDGELTLLATAENPGGGALQFGWTASLGTLGTPEETATSSQVRWTAPSCLSSGAGASFTVTVSNAREQSANARFSAVGIPDCPSWSSVGELAALRHDFTATLLPTGKVLVAGGISDEETVSTAELYDPVTRTWASTGAMSTPREGHTATLLPTGKVLVVGGYGTAGLPQDTAELYDPATGTW